MKNYKISYHILNERFTFYVEVNAENMKDARRIFKGNHDKDCIIDKIEISDCGIIIA